MSWHFLEERTLEVKCEYMSELQPRVQEKAERTNLLFSFMCQCSEGKAEVWTENRTEKELDIQKTDRQGWIYQGLRWASSLYRGAIDDSGTRHGDGEASWSKTFRRRVCASSESGQDGQQVVESKIDEEVEAFKAACLKYCEEKGCAGSFCVSFLCSPEQGAASWEADSLDGTRFAPSKLTSTAERSCSLGSATESCRDSQSGMISKPSTAAHGEVELTSSLADSPARISAQPEKAKVSLENEAVFGLIWPELSVRFDRDTHSWKIRPCLFPEDSMSCSVTLPRWGMMQNGELSELTTPALPTIATESGFWRTPTADDAANREFAINSRGEPKLSAQVKMLPTQQAHNAKGSPGLGSIERGGRHSDLVVEVGGQLNPTWVEWLMGWPIGWTALEPLETDRFQLWLNSYGRS